MEIRNTRLELDNQKRLEYFSRKKLDDLIERYLNGIWCEVILCFLFVGAIAFVLGWGLAYNHIQQLIDAGTNITSLVAQW